MMIGSNKSWPVDRFCIFIGHRGQRCIFACMQVTFRTIELSDNAALAKIIRDSLHEFGADRPGTVFFDPTTDDLYTLFKSPGSAYCVAADEGRVLGGAGVFPSAGLPPDTAELVKMYLHADARGKGIGGELIRRALETARRLGYKKIYLETLPELADAVKVYERFGFERLAGPLGNTGHFGCSVWMLKTL